jgi:GTP-binding protein
MTVPVVALIGRPNVGKSALFNRIVGDDSAIVSEEAGTTRDRHFAETDWAGRNFWLVDTGGIADDPRAPMDVEIRRQVYEAIGEADLILFVVDARVGIHPSDHHVAELLRNARKPWMLVANKVDDPRDADFYEFYNLGAGEVFPVSAINGKGSGDMLDALITRLPQVEAEPEDLLRVAVIGKPNVGKSSFVNKLLGAERLVVSEIAGTTRDAIDTPLRYHGRTFIFVDTAGPASPEQDRGRHRVLLGASERAEPSSAPTSASSWSTPPRARSRTRISRSPALRWEAGRGLIVVVNKWDLFAEKDDKGIGALREEGCEKAPVPQVRSLSVHVRTDRASASIGCSSWCSTSRPSARNASPPSEVNEKLGELVARLQPPQAAGREVRLNYATQVETQPPTIAVFGNAPDLVEEHYVRYLHNGFRSYWGFTGNPLRIVLRRKAG